MVTRHAVLAKDLLDVIRVGDLADVIARERYLRADHLRQGEHSEEYDRRGEISLSDHCLSLIGDVDGHPPVGPTTVVLVAVTKRLYGIHEQDVFAGLAERHLRPAHALSVRQGDLHLVFAELDRRRSGIEQPPQPA